MSNRRQQIKDWLLSTDNPEAEYLLNSLNQMNLDDWEQKHRRQLRRLKGYVDIEKNALPLRDRARGEFDTYVDNPEWYIKGKAAKLGVNVNDLKKVLSELEEERIWNEGRERRAKEVNERFVWNFAPKSSQQRYIDDPNATIFGKEGKYNPFSKEGQDDFRDVTLGIAGTVGDFIPGYGAAVGPIARTIRNEELIRTKSKYAPSLADAGKEFLNDAGTFGAAAWLQNFRQGKRIAAGAEKSIPGLEKVTKNAALTNNLDETSKALDNIRENVDTYDDLIKAVENMPDNSIKADLQSKISKFANVGDPKSEAIFVLESKRDAINHQKNLITTLDRGPGGYVVRNKDDVNFIVKETGGNANDVKKALDETTTIRQKVRQTPTIGKIGQVFRDVALPVYGGLEQGLAKNAATLYKAGPEDKDRAQVDWYKQNYARDWDMGFVPKGREDEPIMKAYKEYIAEKGMNRQTPRIEDIFQ